MMTPEDLAKMPLLAALRVSGDETIETLRALPPDSFQRVCYAGGWNGHEVVAHLAAIEWTYPRLIDLARQAAARHDEPQGTADSAGVAAPLSDGIDGYNARQVARRADIPLSNLIDEFARNRAATIAAVAVIDEPLLAVSIRSAGGIEGSLADVLRWAAVDHVLGHVRDITSGA